MAQSGAAALLIDPANDPAAAMWLQRDLMPRLAGRDFALIVKDEVDLVQAIGADGIHLSDASAVKKLRGKFSDLSIGVACPPERHEAMIAAELGADYVAFDPALAPDVTADQVMALIQWWGEMMTVPSVIFADTPAAAAAFAKAGADFIAVAPGLWQQADPLAALQAFSAAIR
ncbi:MAG TPA: thiamine phosphate synthase [Terriglobia bacterium]|nr:thiamine phosphate synthase [Terriglobia bacterium]